ncbi:hypothetical protein [Paenibacillus harenae]|uniref:hypothetical protein n=1 Tax=Paenibacillus harenae TaxID=306543 RepID=UPI00278EA529|nr:hypothetical protein [Paenibacillus harenae]MDQ0058132.1 methionine-rich copper-binding protein CopC [Paenibacillus harenae]
MWLKRATIMLIACFAMILAGQSASAHATPTAKNNETLSEIGQKPVQVFDVAAGKVVKTIENDADFQKMAADWVSSISDLAPQLSADENCGYVYRVPLANQVTIKVKEISVTTDDIFLFYCKDKPPLLLAFDENRKPFLFLVKADIKPFIQKVGIPALP